MENYNFIDLLRNRGLKATAPRVGLLQTIQDYQSAMPYSAIQKALANTDRVTLYRTLESLKEQGIIHQAFQENNEKYYAICNTQCNVEHHHHDHVHFKCVECDTVTCKQTSSAIELMIPGHQIQNMSITLEGVCDVCIGKDEKSKN